MSKENAMKVYKIDDGGVGCHVVAGNRDQALACRDVKIYFADLLGDEELEVTELNDDQELTIDCDGTKITLTAAEWAKGHKAGESILIAQSEY